MNRPGVLLSLLPVLAALVSSATAAEPMRRLRVELVGDLTAARVSVSGPESQPLIPAGSWLRKTSRGETYFYADKQFELDVPPGVIQLKLVGGLEVTPSKIAYGAAAHEPLTVNLHRWMNLQEMGWYAGDSHVHLFTGGPLGVTVTDAYLAARAEGVHYVNMCISNVVGDDIRHPELIIGAPHEISSAPHLLVFGEEMRSSIYGHMQFFGIKKLVEPQYTGFANTVHHHDFPANLVLAEKAMDQGGLVTYGHPMFKDQPDPFSGDLTADSGAARELPVDAILGAVQAVDLMSYNSDEPQSAELWYRLLNCGLRLAACAGTDALLDRSTDPLGGSRVYVYVGKDKPMTMEAWLEGLRAGRSLVTNGPVPLLTVNDAMPGDTVPLAAPGSVRVQALARSQVPIDQIEVIVNGKVAHRHEVPAEQGDGAAGTHGPLEFDVAVERSSWVALRVRGPDHEDVFDGPAWAHTSPVWIEVAGQPVRSAEDAAYFVEWIDQLLRVVAVRNRYASDTDRAQVEASFRRAQEKYRAIAEGQ